MNMVKDASTDLSPETEEAIKALTYNADGLIPAIAQCADEGTVLMLAWMSVASIRQTLLEGRVVYWSRSRQAFWRKGDTSGHIQQLVEMRFDCDQDCLLLLVRQTGAACHTGRRNCFYTALTAEGVEDKSAWPLEESATD